MNSRLVSLASAVGLLGLTSLGAASDASTTVDESWVLETLKAKNPSLRAAAVGLEQARDTTRLEEGKYPYTFQVDGNYTRANALQLNGQSTRASVSDTLLFGDQVSHVFSAGTTATLRASGQYLAGQASTSPLTVGSYSFAPYQTSLRLTLTQPLLGGAGSLVNQASLRAARIGERKQRMILDRQTSELLRDALLGYWEFWYGYKTVEIQDAALSLAKAQQREAELRVEHGQLSAADALKFRTQAATLAEALINAQAVATTNALDLGRLVGDPDSALLWLPSDGEPSMGDVSPAAVILEKLRAQSPALAEQREALRLARENRLTAGDEYRAQLNAQTWVETGGGSGQLGPAVRQAGTLGAVGIFAGLTFINTVDEKRLHASRAQAAHAVDLAEATLAATIQQLETAALQTRQKAEQANAILNAATQTMDVATQQAENERQRFRLGVSTPLDVQVAEDTLRQARLRVLRAKVDRIKARISLDHATGDLAVDDRAKATGCDQLGCLMVSP